MFVGTQDGVWRLTDIATPSIVLHRPGTRFLYVGGGDGKLYQVDVDSAIPPSTPPAKRALFLEPFGNQIGAPSLDGT